MKSRIFILALAFAISACYMQSHARQDVNEAWTGKSRADIESAWGAPQVVEDEDGEKVLRWRQVERQRVATRVDAPGEGDDDLADETSSADDEADPADDEADPADDEADPADDEADPADDEADPADDEAYPPESSDRAKEKAPAKPARDASEREEEPESRSPIDEAGAVLEGDAEIRVDGEVAVSPDEVRGEAEVEVEGEAEGEAEAGAEGRADADGYGEAKAEVEVEAEADADAGASIAKRSGDDEKGAETRVEVRERTHEVTARVDASGTITGVSGSSIRWGHPYGDNRRYGPSVRMHFALGALETARIPIPSGSLAIGGMVGPTTALMTQFTAALGYDGDEGFALGLSGGLEGTWWATRRLSVRAGPAFAVDWDPGFEGYNMGLGVSGGAGYGFWEDQGVIAELRADITAHPGNVFGVFGVGLGFN